jgi:putative transposase
MYKAMNNNHLNQNHKRSFSSKKKCIVVEEIRSGMFTIQKSTRQYQLSRSVLGAITESYTNRHFGHSEKDLKFKVLSSDHLIKRSGKPEKSRMENGPEFIATLMAEWSQMHQIEFDLFNQVIRHRTLISKGLMARSEEMCWMCMPLIIWWRQEP